MLLAFVAFGVGVALSMIGFALAAREIDVSDRPDCCRMIPLAGHSNAKS
jgi:hypothetical protein